MSTSTTCEFSSSPIATETSTRSVASVDDHEEENTNNKIISKIDQATLELQLFREYRQWKLTKELREYFQQKFDVRKREWLHNTFDRWLLSIHEDEESNYEKDEEFPLYPNGLHTNDSVHKIIIGEIEKELSYQFKGKGERLMSEFIKYIDTYKSKLLNDHDFHSPKNLPKIEINKKTITVRNNRKATIAGLSIGEMKSEKCSRIAFLIEKYGEIPTGIMLLRYESLGTGSYQWGDPIDLHQAYYINFQVRYEGFASPLNSRFLGQKNAKFCSLFPDTDAIFGSLGNFMMIDFNKYSGGWSVNPPFIETLLEDVAKKIIKAMDDSSGEAGCLYFFCCMPYWDDTPGWILLRNSKHLKRHVNFGKSSYVVQNAYGQPLDPHCGLSHFILGYLPEGSEDNVRLMEEVMKKTYIKWKQQMQETSSSTYAARKRKFDSSYD